MDHTVFPWLDPEYIPHLIEQVERPGYLYTNTRGIQSERFLHQQALQHWNLLQGFVYQVVKRQPNGLPICQCLTMSAGFDTWTWRTETGESIYTTAHEYLSWLPGRIAQQLQSRDVDYRRVFAQMYRAYAHIYYEHFAEPFALDDRAHELNLAFYLFLTTAADADMLSAEDLDAMQPLVNLWASSGVLDQDSRIYQLADPPAL